ncbi:MAG: cytochrome c [Acidobacteriia bacterium]|nr:cytochrome c [Terriglobia bacterium]
MSFVRLVGTLAILAAVCGSVVKSQEPSLPEGEGKEVVERMCADQCHGLSTVVSARLTKEQWDTTVKAMVARGAEGTDEDVQKAVANQPRKTPQRARAKTPGDLQSAPSRLLPVGISSIRSPNPSSTAGFSAFCREPGGMLTQPAGISARPLSCAEVKRPRRTGSRSRFFSAKCSKTP